MFVKDLFANLAILSSIIFFYVQCTKDSPLTMKSSLSRKIAVGVLGGLLSNILMQYSIHLSTTIIDLRHIPIILLALFGGAIPALINLVFVIAGRLLIGVNASAYAAIIDMILITAASIYISKRNVTNNKKIWILLSLANLFFLFVAVTIIKNQSILFQIIPAYWILSYLGGFIAYNMLQYLRNTQLVFNKYKAESTIDALTGLNNYRKFDEMYNVLIGKLKSKKGHLSLLYIDIDFFKKINDTYGHSEGDIVLRDLGKLLMENTRSFDVVSRNGGEEFSALLVDCPLEKAVTIAETIRKAVEGFSFALSTGKTIRITVSIGIASYKETTDEAELLIEEADKALYDAKKSGRNRVCFNL